MKKLLNTLFIVSEDAYLSLDGENIVVNRDKREAGRFPLHGLGNVISFSYAGASPALMGACVQRDINLAFCTPRGKFLARVCGESNGNVLLRREQYRVADNAEQSCRIARMMIFGKLYNSRWCIERTCRDHELRVDTVRLKAASVRIKDLLPQVKDICKLDTLRGLEGLGATAYFGTFDEMIISHKATFKFSSRNRRPPLDPCNALMSFAYALLANDCAAALESVGLDSYVGFLHTDRSGRPSLALDLMEELRPCLADRFVLKLINKGMLSAKDFEKKDSGAVFLKDNARKEFLNAWQERKKETISHPYLEEKIPWGMVPYAQALLLARFLRGDLEEYPPFLWK